MGSDDRDSAVYAPFDAIKSHYGYLHRTKYIGEALQLAPKVIKENQRDVPPHACRTIENQCPIAPPWRRECGSVCFDHQIHLIARSLDMGGLPYTTLP